MLSVQKPSSSLIRMRECCALRTISSAPRSVRWRWHGILGEIDIAVGMAANVAYHMVALSAAAASYHRCPNTLRAATRIRRPTRFSSLA